MINLPTGHIAEITKPNKNNTHRNTNIQPSFASKFSEKNFLIARDSFDGSCLIAFLTLGT
ncbi:hypothetical protein HOF65_05625 [bacterium]|jgi:hypothetical protein|nr:hypothetical protein [bacterium]MBT3853420.1 hypothetical protein [bacterium]MBT4633202.1 hypothetical protein [bacterium]MBT5491161.1 hypothetical protein [bacterium]MBT6778467.1 hypothetical protein [bacterium]